MSPMCRRLPPLRFLLMCLPMLVLAGCLGSDFESQPLGVEKWDHGWLIAIEPDEDFSVDLFGSNAYPDSEWRLVEYDRDVLRLQGEEHQKPRAPMPDVEAAEPGQFDEGVPVASSHFSFTGMEVGTTPLRFEIAAGGEPIDIAEYTVEVVEDACNADTVAVANRCGGDGFTTHPQVLHERNYAERVTLEAGETTDLVLTANALHQNAPWRVVSHDDSIITIDGPAALGPARVDGDFATEVDADVSHSLLPAWEFTITGVAAGESELVLEIAVDETRVDLFEMSIVVE